MKTKIIATLGPRSENLATIKDMALAGMDIARINFSHATYEQYAQLKKIVDRAATKTKRHIAIMQDLQGPRIRVGAIANGMMTLEKGQVYIFGCHDLGANKNVIPINDCLLHRDIKKNDPLFLANGDLELVVVKVDKHLIHAEVIRGGVLASHKAINIPKTSIERGGLTSKDIADAKFALKTGVDYIALSFVQSAADVLKLRKIIKASGSHARIIAKIERGVALTAIDEIIIHSDMIMIARGDLGIEIPFEDLPIVQKNLIKRAHWHDKPAIVATQMLTSMIQSSSPTRAEVSDIANAIFDGADAVMLSDETTVGNYPVQAVAVVKKVVDRMERSIYQENISI